MRGTGSHGAGLCRWLTARGILVVEVERPDRRTRRNKAKSDTIDAEAAARKVLSGQATVVPKSGDGNVEMIHVLRVARRSAVVAQGQAANQSHALVTTAPEELREQLRDLTTRQRVATAARFRPGRHPDTPSKATELALKTLARRFRQLDEQIKALDRQITRLVKATAPEMAAPYGIGIQTTATLLITAGTTPSGCAPNRPSPR